MIDQLQQQQIFQQALFNAQQLGNQAAQVQVQNAQAQLFATYDRNKAYNSAFSAMYNQKQYVQSQYEAEQIRQDSIDNQYNILLQNATALRKAMVLDEQMYTRIAYGQAGEIRSDATSRGVISTEGSAEDIVGFAVQEIERAARNQRRNTLNEISQVTDQALALQVEKAFSKWNLDTQIHFTNMLIKDGVF